MNFFLLSYSCDLLDHKNLPPFLPGSEQGYRSRRGKECTQLQVQKSHPLDLLVPTTDREAYVSGVKPLDSLLERK